MMYIFPKKIKSLSIYLMVAGFFGLVYGFLSAPKNIEEFMELRTKLKK